MTIKSKLLALLQEANNATNKNDATLAQAITTLIDGYGVGEETPPPPQYDGEYIITPQAFKSQTLETKNKIMTDNVTVVEIPYFEISNKENGLTVYIGGSK